MTNVFTDAEVAGFRDAVDNHLSYECVIETQVSGGTDAHGQPTFTWDTLYDGPCDYFESASREVVGGINAVVGDTVIVLPSSLSVVEGDRVSLVQDTDGVTVATNLNIVSVLERIAETKLLVEEVR